MIDRYRNKQIEQIWSNEAKYQRWFEIEVENMRRTAGNELAEALARIGPPAATAVGKHEKRVRHDVMAFLLALDDRIQNAARGRGIEVRGGKIAAKTNEHVPKLRQWLHYELTSSDVTDTALGMAVRDTHRILRGYAVELRGAVLQIADRAGTGMTIGRTHGQWARPMHADHPWNVLSLMYNRAMQRWSQTHYGFGKMSGPLGEQRHGEDEALSRLRVDGYLSTQLVPRDLIVHWARELLGVLEVCEAIATKVWFLAQEDVGEVREGRAIKQVGSSAMPHKRNPVMSEHIRGMLRLARGYVSMLEPSVVQWGEHDLAHSCVERVALPDLCYTAARILTQTHTLLANLEFVPEGQRPADRFSRIDTHAELAKLQQEGVPYVEAHARLVELYHVTGVVSSGCDDHTPTRDDAGMARSAD